MKHCAQNFSGAHWSVAAASRRDALAKLLSLSAAQRERGVVAASSGNHGLGVAYAPSVLGGTGIICVPERASPVKVAAICRYGVEVRVLGREAAETEQGDGGRVMRRQHFLNCARRGNRIRNVRPTLGQALPCGWSGRCSHGWLPMCRCPLP